MTVEKLTPNSTKFFKSHIITSNGRSCNYPIIYTDTTDNPRIANMTSQALLDSSVMVGKSYLTIIASNDKLLNCTQCPQHEGHTSL